jgi:hypothetical protein
MSGRPLTYMPLISQKISLEEEARASKGTKKKKKKERKKNHDLPAWVILLPQGEERSA